MASRNNLHAKLKAVIGSNYVYFQPPESLKLTYPCIVYSLDSSSSNYANDHLYKHVFKYSVIFISKNPDEIITQAWVSKMTSSISICSYSRRYIADNLTHDVFDIYY